MATSMGRIGCLCLRQQRQDRLCGDSSILTHEQSHKNTSCPESGTQSAHTCGQRSGFIGDLRGCY